MSKTLYLRTLNWVLEKEKDEALLELKKNIEDNKVETYDLCIQNQKS